MRDGGDDGAGWASGLGVLSAHVVVIFFLCLFSILGVIAVLSVLGEGGGLSKMALQCVIFVEMRRLVYYETCEEVDLPLHAYAPGARSSGCNDDNDDERR